MRYADLWRRLDFLAEDVLDFARAKPPEMFAGDFLSCNLRWLETWTETLLTAAQMVPAGLFELVTDRVLRVHREADSVDDELDTDWKSFARSLVETWLAGELGELPTLHSSHDAELKLESPEHRVWLSRVEPYLVSIDRHEGRGVWRTVWEGARIFHRSSIDVPDLPPSSSPTVDLSPTVLPAQRARLELHRVALTLEIGEQQTQQSHEVYVIAESFDDAREIAFHHPSMSAAIEQLHAIHTRLASLSITVWALESIPEELHDQIVHSTDGDEIGTIRDWLVAPLEHP